MIGLSSRTDLIRLAERCEAASGPDRGLDRDIADTLGLGPDETWERPRSTLAIKRLDEGSWIKNQRIRDSQRYTGSVDAALSLVPQSCVWTLSSGHRIGGLTGFDGYGAEVAERIESADYPEVYARNPALACCGAALRARVSLAGHGA